MTKSPRGKFAILCSLLMASPCLAQPAAKADGKPEGPRVVATSTAFSYVKADTARITFTVTANEPIDRSAREANENQVKKIRDALTALPLNKVEMDVQVVPAAMGVMVTGQANLGGPSVQSRKAQSLFQVTVRDTDFEKLREAVSRIAESACENGGRAPAETDSSPTRSWRLPRMVGGGAEEEPEAVAGPSIEWLANATEAPRRDAIRRAVKEATADAEAAAGSNKLTVVEVMVNSENAAEHYTWMSTNTTPTPKAGLVRVAVQVRVTCTY
ncbi:MAG: SIMPL domain-containing protein [Gemmataceae bacterium]